MIGELAIFCVGTRMIGELATFCVGTRMIGELTTFCVGTRMIGELATLLCAGEKCEDGAAAATTADRARAEPSATHETFNHDEDILKTPQGAKGNLLRD